MKIAPFKIKYALLFTILMLLNQIIFVRSDANSISNICKQTPNYNLCVTSLKSDPRSSKADTTMLALIMVNVIKSRATTSQKLINHLLHKSGGTKDALSSCAEMYDAILTADIPSAIEALEKGDPKFAETGTNDAANEANYCETIFHGKSPLTKFNKVVHDTSLVASAITRLLL